MSNTALDSQNNKRKFYIFLLGDENEGNVFHSEISSSVFSNLFWTSSHSTLR